jgi:hypothetical protein
MLRKTALYHSAKSADRILAWRNTADSLAQRGTGLLFANADSPDLLITDVITPEMSGIELGIQLQQKIPPVQGVAFFGTSLHCRFTRKSSGGRVGFSDSPQTRSSRSSAEHGTRWSDGY